MTRRVIPLVLVALLAVPACSTAESNEVRCGRGSAGILAAQAVPSATFVPCITAFPVGWSYGGFFAESGTVRFWMNSDRAGFHAIEVELAETCDTSGAVEVDNPMVRPIGVRRFDLPVSQDSGLSGATFYTFAGGCVTTRYDFAEDAPSTLLLEARQSIELFPRKEIVAMLAEVAPDLPLCGAEAPPCAGATGP